MSKYFSFTKTCAERLPRFGWVIANRQDRVIPPGILGNEKTRAKFIRSVFAFPFGHTFAWEDDELEVDIRDRVVVEWGLFQGLSIASRRIYASTVTIYLRWASEVNCQDPWPLTETRAALFAAWRLRDNACQVNTIRSNFTHLQEFHRNLGMDWDWTMYPRLKRMFRGWASSCAVPTKKQRKPWLFDIFVKWQEEMPIDDTNLEDVTVWTAALIMFWSLARGSEVVTNSACRPSKYRTLRWKNVHLHKTHASIRLVTAKNDIYHDGADLLLPQLKNKKFCPVHWLAVLANLQARHLPSNKQGWLFPLTPDSPLAMDYFRRRIKTVLAFLGFNPDDFNTHSFRIGGATELFRRGVNPDVIKKLGRWKGDTYEMYTRPDAATCALWARVITTKPVLSDLDAITFLFGDEWRH